MPGVVDPTGQGLQLATPAMLVLMFWYVPSKQTSHSPSDPRLNGVPAAYCVFMYLPTVQKVTVAGVRPVSSEPEHSEVTYS